MNNFRNDIARGSIDAEVLNFGLGMVMLELIFLSFQLANDYTNAIGGIFFLIVLLGLWFSRTLAIMLLTTIVGIDTYYLYGYFTKSNDYLTAIIFTLIAFVFIAGAHTNAFMYMHGEVLELEDD